MHHAQMKSLGVAHLRSDGMVEIRVAARSEEFLGDYFGTMTRAEFEAAGWNLGGGKLIEGQDVTVYESPETAG